MARTLGWILFSAALIAVGVFGHIGYVQYRGEEPQKKPAWQKGGRGGKAAASQGDRSTPVEVAAAVSFHIEERVRGTGVLEPERQVTILARVEGDVGSLLVEEGDSIEGDAPLCTIDEQALRIAVTLTGVEKKHAGAEYARLENLQAQASRSVSPQELEVLALEKERTAAAHEEAQLRLSYARPSAPFSGIVVERFVEKGQHVRTGDALFTLADVRPLRMSLYLPESEAERVRVGCEVELRRERDSAVVAEGTVERISPVVSRESLTVEVLTRFETVPEDIRSGAFARADIIVSTRKDVLLVPRAAVLRQEGQSYVFRVDRDASTVERIDVVTGFEDANRMEIREGLGLGDTIAVAGNRSLESGGRVKVYREIPFTGE